jgi:Fe-S cluster assembly protein SufD
MTRTIQEPPALLANFEQQTARLLGVNPEWLQRLRRDARDRFERLGFPTSRMEEWKNTNVAPIARTAFVPAADGAVDATQVAAADLPGLDGPRLVFVNGRFEEALSSLDNLPGGLQVTSLAREIAAGGDTLQQHLAGLASIDEPFNALNTALFEDGALVVVPDGLDVATPIRVLHLTASGGEPAAAFPRTLILVGAGSRATIVETHAAIGAGLYFTGAVSEAVVGDNAELRHYRIQDESRDAFHIGSLGSEQGRDSRFVSHNFDFGGALARLTSNARLAGEGGNCTLNGLYVTDGTQHVDNHTTLDHAVPRCDSRELYKGVLAGRSRAVFNGRIVVRQDAQKTDAVQQNPNLLLSEDALVHTRPQLEIYADDVKCTHGATIGRLDGNAEFYLRSRGIGAKEARHMLIRAFAGEVLGDVDIEPLCERVWNEIDRRLDSAEKS